MSGTTSSARAVAAALAARRGAPDVAAAAGATVAVSGELPVPDFGRVADAVGAPPCGGRVAGPGRIRPGTVGDAVTPPTENPPGNSGTCGLWNADSGVVTVPELESGDGAEEGRKAPAPSHPSSPEGRVRRVAEDRGDRFLRREDLADIDVSSSWKVEGLTAHRRSLGHGPGATPATGAANLLLATIVYPCERVLSMSAGPGAGARRPAPTNPGGAHVPRAAPVNVVLEQQTKQLPPAGVEPLLKFAMLQTVAGRSRQPALDSREAGAALN